MFCVVECGEVEGVWGFFWCDGFVEEFEVCGVVGVEFDGECVVFFVDWEGWYVLFFFFLYGKG